MSAAITNADSVDNIISRNQRDEAVANLAVLGILGLGFALLNLDSVAWWTREILHGFPSTRKESIRRIRDGWKEHKEDVE